jgi:hypothetical protein
LSGESRKLRKEEGHEEISGDPYRIQWRSVASTADTYGRVQSSGAPLGNVTGAASSGCSIVPVIAWALPASMFLKKHQCVPMNLGLSSHMHKHALVEPVGLAHARILVHHEALWGKGLPSHGVDGALPAVRGHNAADVPGVAGGVEVQLSVPVELVHQQPSDDVVEERVVTVRKVRVDLGRAGVSNGGQKYENEM